MVHQSTRKPEKLLCHFDYYIGLSYNILSIKILNFAKH